MSHPEQTGFFEIVARSNADLIDGGSVLEIGSYDVNGTIRRIFDGASDYIGVDLTEGPGVDHVGFGHEYRAPHLVDLSISAECFEHDENWAATFENMVTSTRPGGLVVFTCASRGRPEHGTRRTDAALSPGTQAVGLDYYQNLTEADFTTLPLAEWFTDFRFWYLPTHFDLYFAGVRAGDPGDAHVGRVPDPAQVADLAGLMPFVHRAARLPLRGLAKTGISEQRYQDLTYRYWNVLLRVAGESSTR